MHQPAFAKIAPPQSRPDRLAVTSTSKNIEFDDQVQVVKDGAIKGMAQEPAVKIAQFKKNLEERKSCLSDYPDVVDHNPKEECVICYAKPRDKNLGLMELTSDETGEPMMRIKGCQHLFCQECLV